MNLETIKNRLSLIAEELSKNNDETSDLLLDMKYRGLPSENMNKFSEPQPVAEQSFLTKITELVDVIQIAVDKQRGNNGKLRDLVYEIGDIKPSCDNYTATTVKGSY